MRQKTLSDCQHDAVILATVLEGIDLMGNEGEPFDNARGGTTILALRLAQELADNLDRIKGGNAYD